MSHWLWLIFGCFNGFDPFLFYFIGFPAASGRGMWLSMVFLIFISTAQDEKFRLRISVALSTLIRVMTRICVERTVHVVPTNQSALHTYPDATLIRRPHLSGCHTYPEAELFLLGGTCKLKKGKVKPHSSSQCSWEPYKEEKNGDNQIKHPPKLLQLWSHVIQLLPTCNQSPWRTLLHMRLGLPKLSTEAWTNLHDSVPGVL